MWAAMLNAWSDPNYLRLRSYCCVQEPASADRFVGLRVKGGRPEVCFPLGYRFPLNFSALQGDIVSLIGVIRRASRTYPDLQLGDRRISSTGCTEFPFRDYVVLVEDFLRTGSLYEESRWSFQRGSSDSISWSRTIANIRPTLNGSSLPIYLDLVSRRRVFDEDATLTLLHEYCLAEAFMAIGWVFTAIAFRPPRLKRVHAEHKYVVARRLRSEFNDRNQRLLTAIFNILSCEYESKSGDFHFGTERFEYGWEYMIERAFGDQLDDRRRFFPKARWSVLSHGSRFPAPLEPDTIMSVADRLFVLDSKYYRFGITGDASHLPGTSDIGKQVIYGQFADSIKPKAIESVHNAFLLPADLGPVSQWCKIVGVATPMWIGELRSFELIKAVVIDMSFLLRNYDRIGCSEKACLAELLARES